MRVPKRSVLFPLAALATVLVLAFLNESAAALRSDTTATRVSGYAGIENESFTLSLGTAGIQSLTWWEYGDKPCSIAVDGIDPDDAAIYRQAQEHFCPKEDGHGNTRQASFYSNPRWFVRGISVCTNDKTNHRMKGIAIVAAKLPPNSDDVNELVDYVRDKHVNCKDWHDWVYCPANQVASGLNVRVKDGSIVGIGLWCAGRS